MAKTTINTNATTTTGWHDPSKILPEGVFSELPQVQLEEHRTMDNVVHGWTAEKIRHWAEEEVTIHSPCGECECSPTECEESLCALHSGFPDYYVWKQHKKIVEEGGSDTFKIPLCTFIISAEEAEKLDPIPVGSLRSKREKEKEYSCTPCFAYIDDSGNRVIDYTCYEV